MTYISPHNFIQEYLIEALKDKMKYIRNAKPRGLGGVKRQPSSDEQHDLIENPAKRQFKPQYPTHSAVNLVPLGEDKASHDRHVKFLHSEERKLTPNAGVCRELMRKTYPTRRADILNNPKCLTELLKMYPSLRRADQVSAHLIG